MRAEPIPRGRPKSEEKARSILSAAAKLFLTHGYRDTSMDAVAVAAGVSKQTVYSHFSHKEALFQACINQKIARYDLASLTMPNSGDLRSDLYTLAHNLVSMLLDPEVMAIHRVVITEAATHPGIAALFFASGPAKTQSAIQRFLSQQVEQQQLNISKNQLFTASMQLISLVTGMYQFQMLLGVIDKVEEAELQHHIQQSVDIFLRLYVTP